MKIFITGANRGLGLGFVKISLEKGFEVFASCRNPKEASELKDLGVHVLQLDITSEKSIDNCFNELSKLTPDLDILINNAGVSSTTLYGTEKKFADKLGILRKDHLIKLFEVNAIAPILVTQKFLPLLKVGKNPYIICISSRRGSILDSQKGGKHGYRGSKGALNVMVYAASIDLMPENIKIFAVDPGAVKTDMNPDNWEIRPEESAKSILEILEKFKPELNGQFLNIKGELYK